jgi:hypothetical protein
MLTPIYQTGVPILAGDWVRVVSSRAGPLNRGFATSTDEDLKRLDKQIAEIEAEIEAAERHGQKY